MPTPVSRPLIQVRNLRIEFGAGGTLACPVDGVDLEIDPGQALGIVGESGSGKSLTALSLVRLLPPDATISGNSEILWQGDDVLRMSSHSIRSLRGRGVGFIFQEPMAALDPLKSVGFQIEHGIRLQHGIGRREAKARTLEYLRLAGLPSPARVARSFPHELSGGMLQRAVIAGALSGEPKLLIADEPTTALDVSVQAQIIALLARLRVEMGLTILLITHDFGVLSQVCERAVVMYAGKIVEQGRTDDVLRGPKHPYTKALIGALPRISGALGGDALTDIPGVAPKPDAVGQGCSFAPRCSRAGLRCAEEAPQLTSFDESRWARCWYPLDRGDS